MAGEDRYFGGREGSAAKALKRAVDRSGAVKGHREYLEQLDTRREAYAGRGRGTALQRLVVDSPEDPG